jgi:hypothetical protein
MTASHVLVAVTLVACVAGVLCGSDQAPADVPFETLVNEVNSGLHERRREAVRDQAAWVRLWAQIHEGVAPLPPLPPVDFSRDMLIAVATGTRPSGGFDITIRSVARRGASLDVVVVETCPARGDRVSLGLTDPVEVVRVERVGQAPAFRETRSASCR